MSVFGRVENVKNDNEKYERSRKKKSECAYLRWKRVRNFEENIENLKKKKSLFKWDEKRWKLIFWKAHVFIDYVEINEDEEEESNYFKNNS